MLHSKSIIMDGGVYFMLGTFVFFKTNGICTTQNKHNVVVLQFCRNYNMNHTTWQAYNQIFT